MQKQNKKSIDDKIELISVGDTHQKRYKGSSIIWEKNIHRGFYNLGIIKLPNIILSGELEGEIGIGYGKIDGRGNFPRKETYYFQSGMLSEEKEERERNWVIKEFLFVYGLKDISPPIIGFLNLTLKNHSLYGGLHYKITYGLNDVERFSLRKNLMLSQSKVPLNLNEWNKDILKKIKLLPTHVKDVLGLK